MLARLLPHYTLILLLIGSQCLAQEDKSAPEYQLDWVPWKELSSEQQESLPLGSCGAYIAPIREDEESDLNPEEAAIRASADRSQWFKTEQGQRLLLIGDTLITQGYRQLQAQQAEYDQGKQTLTAEKELIIREPGVLILGDKASANQADDVLTIDGATYVFHQGHTRGSAASITREGTQKTTLKQASFTQCQPGNNAWQLKGSKIVLNFDKRQGYITNMRLVVKGVPVFYLPYLRFPLGDDRLTGFLAPSFAYEEGLQYSIPFYWNMAPNYDLTLSDHYDQLHGHLWESNFRHLSPNFYTQFNLARLDNDQGGIEKDNQRLIDDGKLTEEDVVPFKDENRWLVNLDQIGGQGKPWSTEIDYTKVSDYDFFDDFRQTGIASSSDTSLEQKFATGYKFRHWTTNIQRLEYQSLEASGSTPYRQIPAFTLDGHYQAGNWQTQLDHEWIRFDHKDASINPQRIIGDRTRLDYQLSYQYEPLWGFFRPALKIKHLQYQLDDTAFNDNAEGSPSITVPQFSLDTGLFFERDTASYLQTFEPRIMYLRSPFKDHSKLFNLNSSGGDVDFDTSELGFSFNQVFRDTRFSGGDRLDDANQISLGLTTRFIGNQSGREWFSASVGRIYYREDRRVTLNNNPQIAEQSDIAVQLRANPAEGWRLTSDLLFTEDNDELKQGNLGLNYRTPAQNGFDVNYRYVRGSTEDQDIRQINGSFISPALSRSWHLLFYGAYDYTNSRELDLLSAVQYINCCYKIRLGYHHQLDTELAETLGTDELDYDFKTFFEVQFRGLGSTGKQLDNLLEEQIDAYSEWQATHY